MDNNKNLATVLKELEDLITTASRVPLTGKVIVDGDAILEYVDKIYTALPDELKQAQQVLEQSDKLLESVEGQGKRILQNAREQAAQMTQETEIYKEATMRAEALMNQAEQGATELRKEALLYSDDVLAQLENNLGTLLVTIRNNRAELHEYKYFDKPEKLEPAASDNQG